MLDQELLRQYSEAVRTPIQLFEDTKLIHDFGTTGFQPNPAPYIIQCAISTMHPVCYTISQEFLYAGLVRLQNTNRFFVVGPAMTYEPTRGQTRKLLLKIRQPEKRTDELLHWLHLFPRYDVEQFCSGLQFLDSLVNGPRDRETVYVPYDPSVKILPPIEIDTAFIDHLNDLLEKELVSCVEFGNTERLNTLFNELYSRPGTVPPIAPDGLRSYKDIFIFSVGVASRAALRGGLNFDVMNSITSYYLQQVEKLEGYQSISAMLRQMFTDFSERTKRSRTLSSDSPTIRKMDKIVLSHLEEKISPTMISEQLGMNCSYLCRLFMQETGETISEHVNKLKIEEGKRLLKTTDLPIAQIAVRLGFSSQNYFHTVFRRVCGMSPSEYRRSLNDR